MGEELKELEIREVELLSELSTVRKAITEARLDAIQVAFGVKVGSIVVDESGKEHNVVAVETRHFVGCKPWVSGNPKKKDGTFGTTVRNLYTRWEVVTP